MVASVLHDRRELLLLHVNGHEGRQRVAGGVRADAPIERQEHAGALQRGHPRLHRVAAETEPVGERHVGRARVVGEGDEDAPIGAVEGGHSAKPSTARHAWIVHPAHPTRR